MKSDNDIIVNNLGQYIKSLNFDVITSPYKLAEESDVKPSVNFKVSTKTKKLKNDDHEVVLNIEAATKNKEKDEIFNIELEYSGIFKIKGAPSEKVVEEILLVNCVTLLFPFARQKIADITMHSGFQPLMIDPIDFRQIYLQSKQENKNNDIETINTEAV